MGVLAVETGEAVEFEFRMVEVDDMVVCSLAG